ncbi:hypothetical protein [Bacillus alkalicellulosilyticus]|uniref:hypothetical protein n=1 Tax=Alkalihalobacterium alkalicellulosilyticum TaxID=1912214 RepID=UPI0009971332|nr:hypothetical protein [Bacillus alkalicellulosilyticus]
MRRFLYLLICSLFLFAACQQDLEPKTKDKSILINSISKAASNLEGLDNVHVASGTLSRTKPLITLELIYKEPRSIEHIELLTEHFYMSLEKILINENIELELWKEYDLEIIVRTINDGFVKTGIQEKGNTVIEWDVEE